MYLHISPSKPARLEQACQHCNFQACAKLLVTEVRRRASNQSTEAAASAIASFLEVTIIFFIRFRGDYYLFIFLGDDHHLFLFVLEVTIIFIYVLKATTIF